MARWSIPLVCLVVGGVAGSFVAGPVLQGQNSSAPVVTALPKELTSYRDVVKKVLPAVVSIETRSKPKPKTEQPAPRRRFLSDDSPIPEEFRKFLEEFDGRQFQFEFPNDVPHHGFGSGFLVDPKGVVLTNFHVVDGADEVEVQLKDGRKFRSKDIHSDSKTDLALVRIDAKTPLPYLELGDSDGMEIGDRVLAVGAPFGLTGSVTAGIISAKRRDLEMNMYEDFLQTDAAINPGNSGGPLVNLEGRVVGINSVIKSRSGGWQGVGLAISSNLAKNVMQQLLATGSVHRGYLGIKMARQELEADLAARLGVKDEGGVIVEQVVEGTPAAKAGIQDGDVITAVAGKPVKNRRELQRLVAGLPLHKPVDITVVRDGKVKILPVTVEEQPSNFAAERKTPSRSPTGGSEEKVIEVDRIGLAVTDVTPERAEQFGYKSTAKGALITEVARNSLAAEAGLARGMLIVKVDKKPVASAQAFADQVDKASLEKGVLLQTELPRGGTNYIMLKSEAAK